ncbi:MAG: S8 family serine peptidase, partial [Caldiserica bacterium]|nr:S8 family serine peptidase [Caldisericota bacterium]
MNKKLTLIVIFSLVISMFQFAPIGAKALEPSRFEPDVTDELLNMINDAKPSQNIDVIVWSNSNIERSLSAVAQSVNAFPKFGCYSVTIGKDMFDSLEGIPGVTRITQDYKITAPKVKIDADDDDEGQSDFNWGLTDLGIKKLWDKGLTGKGVKVGLLDTGVDADHPALKGKVEKFVMFEMDGTKVDSKPFDNIGHGTHCAGIIAGSDPKKKNGPGVAPDVKLIVGSVLPGGSGMFAQVLGGMEWILDPDGNPKTDDAPDIVSMSLGGIPDAEMTVVADAFQRQGVALVASIGNDGAGSVGSPGCVPSVFSVGSYDVNRKVAYSSSGAVIDWDMNPYHDITVTKPDIAAPGVSVYSCFPGGEYVKMSGTSMACPHVAGSAALLLQAKPDLTSTDIGYVLSKTADDLGVKGWDIRWGSGAININKAIDYLPNLATVNVNLASKIDQPVIININGKVVRTDKSTAFHVDPGNISIDMSSFGYASVSKKLNLKANASETVVFDTTKLPTVTYKGTLVGENGEDAQGLITIAGAPSTYTTDEVGDFEIELPKAQLDVEFWAIGFKTVKKTLDMGANPDKIIKLKPTKTLVATSQLTTPSSSSIRRFDKYIYKTLDELKFDYCSVNPRKFKLTYSMLKKFDKVYWFGGEASLKLNDANALHKYLLNGGKLVMSGRNMLYYEAYRREHNFIQYHFQVRPFPDDTFTTTSVGLKGDAIGDGMALSLSGGDGAANQLGYDTFSIPQPAKNIIPFMSVLTPSDKGFGDYGYTGVRIINPTYLGVFLSFGVEGIGNKGARLDLIKKIDGWLDSYGGVDASFVDDQGKPVFAKISVEGMPDNTTGDDGTIKLHYLPKGWINIKANAMGFDEQTFKAEVVPGKVQAVQFQLTNPKTITVAGQVFDPSTKQPMACQVRVSGKDSKVYKTDDDGKFNIKLPKFAYSLKFFKKGYTNIVTSVIDNNDKMVVNLLKTVNTTAFVQQFTPSWESMAFAGIGQTYDRIARNASVNMDTIAIPPGAKISIEDLEQYQSVIWLCGFNDEIGEDWWFDVITQYIKDGGKIALIGELVPLTIMNRPEFAKLLGVDVVDEDAKTYTIKGVDGDPLGDGMLFSLWHPYIRSGFIATTPSMRTVGNGVSCFDLLGSGSAAIRVKTDKQTSLVMSFGFEQMFTSMAEDKT